MSNLAWIGAGLFVFGYALIAMEQKFNTHKSAIALLMGGSLWMLAALAGRGTPAFTAITNETAINIFSIISFSLASMALIEIMAHYRFFDYVRMLLIKLRLGEKGQFVLFMALCFILSGVLDNISLTICFIQIARRFFSGKNLLLVASGIVVAANAGGAWSPIGDVTSLLLWLGGKLSATQMISGSFLPTLALISVSGFWLYRKLDSSTTAAQTEEEEKIELSRSEKLVIGSALGAFVLPLIANLIEVQPYTARLFGLGITWAVIELVRVHSKRPHKSHLTANIDKIVQSVDLSSIMYLMGILLGVGALSSLGVLAYLSQTAVGAHPTDSWLITLSSLLGMASAFVDNSALVAIAMHVFPIHDPHIWVLIGIMAGTGGSLTIFGSAAGVVAMGSVKDLTFQAYLKLATAPVVAGMIAALGVWFLQYLFLWS
ncbi:MAG TPA: SLC13 family permease [Candidatus Saccharimonadales bacterium]|nr:SLC13 family permease [Candidatus Saccharimonadales bacterium]